MNKTAIIFGGSGFIGAYFAELLFKKKIVEKVILADIAAPRKFFKERLLKNYFDDGSLEFISCDVRKNIQGQINQITDISLIANFAAVHREPGHDVHEYYTTNILGAENVCQWASDVCCDEIIFTSSIAPYGVSESKKSETDTPCPVSAYGGSKLVAEKIHNGWQKENSSRTLTIVRPGVVFGPGEGGNVSRLIKATLKGYFFFMGNQNTRKAGIYVRELTNAMFWMHKKNNKNTLLFNMTMEPAPSISEYVDTIKKISGSKKITFSLPFNLLYSISFVIDSVAKLLRIDQPISPIRLKKLVRSNHIVPDILISYGYKYEYTLNSAMAEWIKALPEEWLVETKK